MIFTFLKFYQISPKLLNRKGLRLLNVTFPVQETFLRFAAASCGCPDSPCPTTQPACGSGGGGRSGKHQITFKPYVPPCYKDHDHKNMELNRPMSPHLEIYGPTVPAMTSIAQRATGTILTFYAMTLAGAALFLPNGIRFVLWNMGKLLEMKEIYSSAYASIAAAAVLAALFAMR